ncbi:MAG: hypothetical protein K6T85_11895 [Gorillibacterium sp.]|nr:hypothetical protein [Gorillibacterium sp.]
MNGKDKGFNHEHRNSANVYRDSANAHKSPSKSDSNGSEWSKGPEWSNGSNGWKRSEWSHGSEWIDGLVEEQRSTLDIPDELVQAEVEALIQSIKLIPEPPAPRGFVEEALANWRQVEQRGFWSRVPAAPVPLRAWQKTRIVLSQKLWRDALLGALLFIIGWLVLRAGDILPPIFVLPIVGCIPLLVSVQSIARQVLCGMGELTRSFRFPLQEYLHARLLLMGAASLLLNVVVMLISFPEGDSKFLIRVALLWCIPLLVNAAVSLILAARIRHVGQLSVLLALLPIIWLVLLSEEKMLLWATSTSLSGLASVVILLALVLSGVTMANERYWKRGGFLHGA